jgi:hypothetical protein
MIPYWASRFTSTATQAAIKVVECEHCQCQFAYQMIRRYSGEGYSPYSVDNAGARNRAVNKAQGLALAAIHQHEDPVACPGCGRYQRTMIDKNRARFWRWTPWGKGNNIDPEMQPHIRGHFPGAPTAVPLIPGTHQPSGVPTYERPPDLEPDGAVAIRLGRDPLATCCCVCLGAPENALRVGPLQIPICKPCRQEMSKLRLRRGSKIVLMPAAIVYALFLITFFLATGLNDVALNPEQRFGFPLLLAIPSLVMGGIISLMWWNARGTNYARPAQQVGFDPVSLVCKIKFANPQYIEQIQAVVARTPVAWTLSQESPPADQPVA